MVSYPAIATVRAQMQWSELLCPAEGTFIRYEYGLALPNMLNDR